MTPMSDHPFDLQIDRLFDEAFQASGRKVTVWSPYCNAWEDGDRFCLEMALPGWDSKDVKITVEDGVLTVEGSRQSEAPESDRTYFVREMTMTSVNFTRSLRLPSYVNAEKAAASFKHGVLSIEFLKREEAKSHQITIEAH